MFHPKAVQTGWIGYRCATQPLAANLDFFWCDGVIRRVGIIDHTLRSDPQSAIVDRCDLVVHVIRWSGRTENGLTGTAELILKEF